MGFVHPIENARTIRKLHSSPLPEKLLKNRKGIRSMKIKSFLETAGGGGPSFETFFTKLVVNFAFFLVLEDFIGFSYFFELLFGVFLVV